MADWSVRQLAASPRTHLLVVLVIHGLLRAWFFVPYVNSDLLDYLITARHIGEGTLPHSNPFFGQNDHLVRWGVVLPLAGLLPILGMNFTLVFTFGLAVSCATLAVLHAFMRHLFGLAAATLAAVFWVFLPFQDLSHITGHAHSMAALLSLSSVYLLALGIEREPGSRRRMLLAGALLGLAQVTVPSAFLFVPALAAWWILSRTGWRRELLWAGGALGVVLAADFVFSWAWFGDPLFRYHESSRSMDYWLGVEFTDVSLVRSFTEAFNPLTLMGRALGLFPWIGLAGSFVLIRRQERWGRLIALAWLVPYVLLRLVPYRFSPIAFLAPVVGHWAILQMPFTIASGAAALAPFWETHRRVVLAVSALLIVEALALMHVNGTDMDERFVRPSLKAYEITRGGSGKVILDFVTKRHFSFRDDLRESPRLLDVGAAKSSDLQDAVVVVNPTSWKLHGVRMSEDLEKSRPTWVLLHREEYQGRLRIKALLRLRLERMQSGGFEVYRIP